MQAQKTKSKIFNTAVDMISQHGFSNVTVDDICKGANVAKGSFYHYFKSKDDIVIQTYRKIDDIYEKMIIKLPPESTSIEKIIASVMFQAKYAKRSGVEHVRQIYRSQVEAGTAYFISEERPFFKVLCGIIVDGQNKHQLKTDLTAPALTRFVLTMSRGIIYDWCVHDDSYDIEDVMKKYFRLLIRSISNTTK